MPDIDIQIDDRHVATIQIRRPPNNFFDTALIADLADACEAVAAEGGRVLVLCSEGRHFCAGADFSGTSNVLDEAGPHLYDMAIRLFRQPLPIVAAIQGAAIGGGLGLAMAADFRVATADARMSANFARLGFHQGFGLSVTLPFIAGHQTALDLLYTGRRVDGVEAHRLGLVDRLVEPDDLLRAAHDLAGEIALSAPLAVQSIRHTMRAALADDVSAALDRERSEQERLQRTSDWREGVRAMGERRIPEFTGR